MLEFFTAQINNPLTRRAYLNASRRFAACCAEATSGRFSRFELRFPLIISP